LDRGHGVLCSRCLQNSVLYPLSSRAAPRHGDLPEPKQSFEDTCVPKRSLGTREALSQSGANSRGVTGFTGLGNLDTQAVVFRRNSALLRAHHGSSKTPNIENADALAQSGQCLACVRPEQVCAMRQRRPRTHRLPVVRVLSRAPGPHDQRRVTPRLFRIAGQFAAVRPLPH
jgi:hypothetical protein